MPRIASKRAALLPDVTVPSPPRRNCVLLRCVNRRLVRVIVESESSKWLRRCGNAIANNFRLSPSHLTRQSRFPDRTQRSGCLPSGLLHVFPIVAIEYKFCPAPADFGLLVPGAARPALRPPLPLSSTSRVQESVRVSLRRSESSCTLRQHQNRNESPWPTDRAPSA